MSTVDDAIMKYRKRADELWAQAATETDPEAREALLKAANACEEMASWEAHKPREP